MGLNGKHFRVYVFSLVLFLSCAAIIVEAAPTLSISSYKNNGYGWGNDIGGLWTINTDVSPDVIYVEFYLDDQLQQNTTTTPFSWQFDTNSYTLGEHTIKVVAYDSSGTTAMATKQANFVEYSIMSLVPIGVAVIVIMVVVLAVLLYRVRRK